MTSLKYARLERERRFLLADLPRLDGARVLEITDRYVEGTRLRLRRVEEEGTAPVLKLGQKIPTPDGIAHTTTYLDAAEFALLAELPAKVLRKTRYLLGEWAVDAHPRGLVLAETEGTSEPPFPVVREVTDEVEFSGGALAQV